MKRFLVDLHIHTLLSPCGDLDMSPDVIVGRSLAAGLDAIAICDHNSTLQTRVVTEIGKKMGLTVFYGMEITTREEAHCVAILPDADAAAQLQAWVDSNIIRVGNNPEKLGDQVWVDVAQNIMGSVEWYLNSPVACSVEQTAAEVVQCGGLFVPAHIDRPSNSLVGQLGFISAQLPVAAVEYNDSARFGRMKEKQRYLDRYTAYTASDAHFPNQIGSNPSWLYAGKLGFGGLRMAFAREDGCIIVSRKQEQ